MTCLEVTELMQRYLDKDLSKEENEQLMNHLEQCSNCASMFERMKHLSHELTNLPKVTPPFSLVDRIMPQLEEVDRVSAKKIISWKQRFFSSKANKVWGSAAAVAMILAIIITNGLPPSFQQSAKSTGNAEIYSNDNPSSNHTSIANDSLADESDIVEDIVTPTKISMRSMDVKQESNGLMDRLDASDSNEIHVLMGSDHVNKSMITEQRVEDQAGSQYGIAEFVEVPKEQMSSPDGKYIASIERIGDQQKVVITTSDHREIKSSHLMRGDDLIFNLQWSQESDVFEYMVDDGTSVERYSIHLSP